MVQTKWIIKNSQIDDKKPLIEKLLEIRGITKKTEIKEFLNPLEMKLSSPTAFSDMEKAVKRISKAIENNEKILIYGDFDADGITSTSILFKTLNHLGANVDYFIPDRESDSHGLNNSRLVKLLAEKKMKLVITVDCGVSNVDEVKFLKSFKVDCIITDHHEAPEILPEAYAIINPKAPNALDKALTVKKIEHLTALAGCGVAFKLAQALLLNYNKEEYVNTLIPYAAVGTIADIVPLIGENRYLVQKGLNLISQGEHYGLKRLLEQAGCSLENLTSEKIAFSVAPRINACGRLDDVKSALNILISDNKQEIEMAIIEVNNFNKIRQELCNETFLQACDMVKNNKESAIILFNKDWHIGIIGIVASKLVETFHKPAFLMTYSEVTKNIRCSARSIKGIHLYDTICSIEELLDGFGGHEMAAGLAFSEEKSNFEQVKKALLQVIDEKAKTIDLTPTLDIDCELLTNDVDVNLINEISKLEPFGAENPSPVFCIKNAVLKKKTLMGQDKNHLKLIIEKDGKEFQCVWWGHGDISLIENDTLDIAFSPQLNDYRGEISLQLILKDIHSEYLEKEKSQKDDSALKIYDHRKKKDIFNAVNDYCKNSKTDIAVFAEDKNIVENLKPYKDIYSKIINTNTLKQSETLMFFDYPADDEHYRKIIETVSPHRIHFMEGQLKIISTEDFIKTLSGMIKFVINNKDGIFETDKAASFLGVNDIAITTALDFLNNEKFINILDNTDSQYKLKFGTANTLKNIENEELELILNDIYEFKTKMMTEPDLEEYLQTIS